MIPKIIHYCWFGGKEKPEEVVHCIASWKEKLPGYKIIEWNEKNFDIENANLYVRQAYEKKKWAFVSDYVRLKALYENGGVYFDTDVEAFQNFEPLLNCHAFMGFESNDYIGTATIACEKKFPFIKEFMDSYEKRPFIKENGTLDMETNVNKVTELLSRYGLKRNGRTQMTTNKIIVYEQSFFASNDLINVFDMYRKNIYSYHHYLSSWYNKPVTINTRTKLRHYFIGKLRNLIGTDTLFRIKIALNKYQIQK